MPLFVKNHLSPVKAGQVDGIYNPAVAGKGKY